MKVFVPGVYDYIFKAIMTNEEHIDYVQHLIEEITGVSRKELNVNFKILSPFLSLTNKKQKRGQVDTLYQYQNHNYVNIEMNKKYSKSLLIKNNYYHCKLMSEQFFSGKPYYEGKVIQINLNMFEVNNPSEINLYKILDTETYMCENENFIKYYVNVEKIHKRCYNKDNKELTLLERMLLVLVGENAHEIIKWAGQEEFLKKVVRRIIMINDNQNLIGVHDCEEVEKIFQSMLKQEEKDNMEKELKEIYDKKIQEGIQQGIEQGIERGIEQGIERGIEQGIEQGIERGIEQGIKHGEEKGKRETLIELAKKMLNINMDIPTIISLTGLTSKQIKSLK